MIFSNQDYYVLHQTRRNFINRLKTILKPYQYDHYCSRIKSEQSISTKLQRRCYDVTTDNAIEKLSDIIGIRIVCQYLTDVYQIVHVLHEKFDIKSEEDYIAKPKSSGYRSYHLIIEVPIEHTGKALHKGDTIDLEIQIRTMGMDFWASLEHSLIYNKIKSDSLHVTQEFQKNEPLIQAELFRYAEDIFAIDMRLQALEKLTKE